VRKKGTYKTVHVEQVRVAELLPLVALGCIVALDVAKEKFVVAIATLAGEVLNLFRFKHPDETQKFLDVMHALRLGTDPTKIQVAMEPTGTYGDGIRSQLVKMGFGVQMVSPQRTHDSQSMFDGVRSLHDPKSASVVAKLCSMKLATPWVPPPESRTRLRALVDLRHHEHTREEACFGRLEASLARYWPEFGRWMEVRQQKSALRLLAEFTSPARTASDPKAAAEFLREASHARLSTEVIDGVVASASSSLGLVMMEEEIAYVRRLAVEALDARERAREVEARMKKLAASDEVFARLEAWMGTYTAAVLVTMCDPRNYEHAKQLEKACGLNLREKSSGEFKGRLSITKRGPGVARQVLYLFALRMIESSRVVRAWYERRRGYTEESKLRAVVAVMRKLVRAAFYVARGSVFDAEKLFDTRRLDLDETTTSPRVRGRVVARTSMRSSSKRSSKPKQERNAAHTLT
jgi:transposase